jgi:hypothetical protein
MTAFALFFAILGACYVSYLIMKFIIWIDGIDELEAEEDPVAELEATPVPIHVDQRKNAA